MNTDLGKLLFQEGHEDFIHGHAEYRGFVRRPARVGRVVDRVLALGDALNGKRDAVPTQRDQPRRRPHAEPGPGLGLAVFRITQEALTNVLRHAGDSATATVTVDYGPTQLELSITDTGRGAVSNLTDSGGGNGLIGMRERVDAYNGRLTTGPSPGGGYQVRAVFPLDEDTMRPGITSSEAADREQIT